MKPGKIMDKDFCRIIDEESLIEKYVERTLPAEIRLQLEQHIKECPKHAQAMRLEKLLSHGIKEYARHEMKQRLKDNLARTDDIKVLILRFAAILFIAILIPVLLYFGYQLYKTEPPIAEVAITPESDATAPPEQKVNILDTQFERHKAATSARAVTEVRTAYMPAELIIIVPDSVKTAQDIRKTIQTHETEIKQCVSKNLTDLETFAIEFTVLENGKIDSIGFSDELNAQMEARTCLENIIGGFNIKPSGKIIQVYFRFTADSSLTAPVSEDIDTP